MRKVLTVCLCFLLFLFLSARIMENKKKHTRRRGVESIVDAFHGMSEGNTSIDCDTSLWQYVYNPARLQVIEKCKTVTGIIEESNADEDGDQHMLLKLDKGQKHLLKEKNKKKKGGDLVIEAVCVNKVLLKKVGSTCEGYINRITLPRVGSHVKVTGSYVIDSHNGWAEIHPITKIELMH